MEIMTGAPMPVGADCIVPVEDVVRSGEEIMVDDSFEPQAGRFIHWAGSDARAGDRLLAGGVRLGCREIGIAASCGAAWIEFRGCLESPCSPPAMNRFKSMKHRPPTRSANRMPTRSLVPSGVRNSTRENGNDQRCPGAAPTGADLSGGSRLAFADRRGLQGRTTSCRIYWILSVVKSSFMASPSALESRRVAGWVRLDKSSWRCRVTLCPP
ncbi:MAG: hypothetical protein IPJ59_33185 [Nannocystis sp.]|nr:hypothetical protein [Nannocystis sp.]